MGFKREPPLAIICFFLGAALLTACLSGPKDVEVEFSSVEPTQGVEVLVPDQNLEVPLGKTPFRAPVDLEPGSYTYIASAPGYHPLTGEFTIGQGQQTVQVWIPRMQEAGGEILVHSSAAAEIAINGSTVGDCEANSWTSFGHFAPGEYTVEATTLLASQEQTVVVAETASGRVQFTWGSRLIISVEPSEIISLTLNVDGDPYKGPMEISAEQMTRKAFVQVEASAPGYQPWADVVFLTAGGVTNVEVELEEGEVAASPTVPPQLGEDVLVAYWKYWDVLRQGFETMDASGFEEVMTGESLESNTESIITMQSVGIASFIMTPLPHTPTVAIVSEVSATVDISCDTTQVFVREDGSQSESTVHLKGFFTMALGPDNVWRVARWTPTQDAGPSPSPTTGGSIPGPTRPPTANGPADRGMVVEIIHASINCIRADQGMEPLAWNQGLADALQPVVEKAKDAFREQGHYPDWLDAEINAAVAPFGAQIIALWGIELSYCQMCAEYGEFAYDWWDYEDRPCETGYGAGGYELGPWSEIAIVIAQPYWDGAFWKSTIIIAVR